MSRLQEQAEKWRNKCTQLQAELAEAEAEIERLETGIRKIIVQSLKGE